ncbi:3-methylcrotonyl-CoA carboxylase beta subunit [Pseudoscourfieldia marina]
MALPSLFRLGCPSFSRALARSPLWFPCAALSSSSSSSSSPHFALLPSAPLPSRDALKANGEHMQTCMQDFLQAANFAAKGGTGKYYDKHIARAKLTARDRVARLLDPGSPFLEIGMLAGHHEGIPSAALVTGLGLVHGRLTAVVANDATVKGGTYHPITCKKQVRMQTIAEKCRLPCVYIVDSGGANLPKQHEVFPDREHFGRIFYNMARMSALGLPQIALVVGSCTAGGAYVPAMADEACIVKGNGAIYLAGPPLVKAATGEEVTSEQLGGADVHCASSGLTDGYARDELAALRFGRRALAASHGTSHEITAQTSSPKPHSTPSSTQLDGGESAYDLFDVDAEDVTPHHNLKSDVEPPLGSPDELLECIPAPGSTAQLDMRFIASRIFDGGRMHEYKPRYGTSMLCGYAHLNGELVGVVGNASPVLFEASAKKGASFIQLCDQRGIPLIFLQDVTGFMVGSKHEANGLAKDGACMVRAVSCATVPKLTLFVNRSYGAGNYGMCGRAYEPHFAFSWPNSRIAVMGGEQAKSVLEQLGGSNAERLVDEFDAHSTALFASSNLWDDGVIDPRDTRRVLSLALQAALNGTRVSAAHTSGVTRSKFGPFRL